MARYGCDRPDLRFGAPLTDLCALLADSEVPFLREGAARGAAKPALGRLRQRSELSSTRGRARIDS